jgi:hypothetical protein
MPKGIVWTAQAQADLRGVERIIALQILKTLAGTHRLGRETLGSFRASNRT